LVHIGKKIQEVQQSSGLSVTAFARNINCTRGNVYAIFARSTIDTGLLQRIGKVLNYDFFQHYTTTPDESQLEKEMAYLTEINELLRQKPEQQNQQAASAGRWRKR